MRNSNSINSIFPGAIDINQKPKDQNN